MPVSQEDFPNFYFLCCDYAGERLLKNINLLYWLLENIKKCISLTTNTAALPPSTGII